MVSSSHDWNISLLVEKKIKLYNNVYMLGLCSRNRVIIAGDLSGWKGSSDLNHQSLHVVTTELNKGIQDNTMIGEGCCFIFWLWWTQSTSFLMQFYIIIRLKHEKWMSGLSSNCKMSLSVANTGTLCLELQGVTAALLINALKTFYATCE